jgi:hypothetical protein
MRLRRLLLSFLLLFLAPFAVAKTPVYVVLWFDTEDYIDPIADDAALRIATDLTRLGVPATFKVVGEKARVLESRHRTDVIAALNRHAVGFHSNWHSVHPTPSEYLRRFGYLDGAEEFQRREGPGAADIRRIFGVTPVCYGQPGNSWGPQSNLALRRMGIPVYLDEGDQVGLDEQPFWYDGILYVFHMGQNQFRAELNVGDEDPSAYQRFDQAVSRLGAAGGGVISIYYHPTEFVHTEFWDAPNFSNGANPPRSAWVLPKRRTAQDADRCFHVLHAFVVHMKQTPGVQFVSAKDLPRIFQSPLPPQVDTRRIAEHLRSQIVFLRTASASLSPADMLIQLLGLPPQVVDGPIGSGSTTLKSDVIPSAAFDVAQRDAADFIRRNHRLPNEVFLGAETISLKDLTATLANALLQPGAPTRVVRGEIGFDRYFSTDPRKSFDWIIHPTGFAAPELLDLGRLQGWTLKPAVLRGGA